MRIAILDLGTNTFNLLIIETAFQGPGNIILNRKEPVKLGEAGITQGIISEKAFQRGIAAIETHMKYIKDCRADQIHAFATSAIRSAVNGLEFIRIVYQKFNIGIQVISGDKEAGLIYLGVKQVVPMGDRKHLIMDIGGGSNELIIANNNKIFYKKSFPLGMARLLEQFRPSDPIREDEILAIENYFSKSLGSFAEEAIKHGPKTLIGSSGSFDTIRALLKAINNQAPGTSLTETPSPGPGPVKTGFAETGSPEPILIKTGLSKSEAPVPFYRFTPEDFFRLHQVLIQSNAVERLNMEGMDPMRVEMIVIAGIFINYIVRKLNIEMLIQSDYALKEGAVIEILSRNILLPRTENKFNS